MNFLQPTFIRQVRAARSILGWSQKDLAARSGVSLSTLNRLERGDGDSSVHSLRMIQATFEQAGIQFINNPDGSIGVVLSAKGLADGKRDGSVVGSES